jgi:hypothetical protein
MGIGFVANFFETFLAALWTKQPENHPKRPIGSEPAANLW